MIGKFPAVLNFNRFICNQRSILSVHLTQTRSVGWRLLTLDKAGVGISFKYLKVIIWATFELHQPQIYCVYGF